MIVLDSNYFLFIELYNLELTNIKAENFIEHNKYFYPKLAFFIMISAKLSNLIIDGFFLHDFYYKFPLPLFFS
jgi:hypothetical protein